MEVAEEGTGQADNTMLVCIRVNLSLHDIIDENVDWEDIVAGNDNDHLVKTAM